MPDVSDMELLRNYDRQGSEEAFVALVQRHINLVYSVALRHVGIAAHAEEITQAVFVILARKAASLRPDAILEGWLHETTRLTSLSFMRGERRRQFREQEAYMQSTLQESTDVSAWNQVAPLLDEAMSRLGKKDRDAVMLRFFKDKSLREVAAALRVNEAAAQRRVHRAVEKLRGFFTKRGIVLPTAVLTAAISANSVQAAPAMLAKTATAVAFAKGATASASTLTLIKGALKIMAWTKAKTAVVAGVVVLLAAGTTTVIVKEVRSQAKQLSQSKPVAAAYPGDWIWEFNSQTLDRVPPLLLLQPTKMPASRIPADMFGNHRYLARGKTIKELIARIYSQKNSEAKLIFLDPLPDDKFDCIVTLTNWPDALESEINKRFNLVEQWGSQAGETVVVVRETGSQAWQWIQPKLATNAYPGDWIWKADSQTLDSVPPLLLLQPTTMPANYVPFDMFGNNRYLARGKTVKELITAIYSQINSEAKLTFLAPLPDDKFDCIIVQTNWPDALESEINKRFNLVTQYQSTDAGSVVIVKKAP
jgi:RNA polymerase sigma factor (sigma-70 family)